MEETNNNNVTEETKTTLGKFIDFIKRHTNILEGTDREGTVLGIERDIEFKGPNLWILVCSILIASIGLNTNSTAVIIGAMLISPLMGPIVGIGYSAAVYDYALLMRSLRNFGLAVAFAVITSTLYFLISPLYEIQSELLARTRPTIFDVLIAFFGGFAGIIAGSRKEKSNVIPGVAIATALMPPLCTAGFGIATGNMQFFLGAFYLFFINSVFICLASLIGVRFLRFNKKVYLEKAKEKKVKQYISAFIIITIIPSLIIAIDVANESVFRQKADAFVKENITNIDGVFVLSKELKYNSKQPIIKLSVLGETIDEPAIKQLEDKLSTTYGLRKAKLEIVQAKSETAELAQKLNSQVRIGVIEDLYTRNEQILKDKEEEITKLKQELSQYSGTEFPIESITKELQIQYPTITTLGLSTINSYSPDTDTSIPTLTAIITVDGKLSSADKATIKKWLLVRLNKDDIEVIYI